MARTLTTNSPPTPERERYDFANKIRELELDLFWKRSLFFWGFIGAAFVAFAAVRDNEILAVLVGAFGFVCSFIWTFANRGSKFWYENWEQKLETAELPFTGPWFGSPEPPRPNNWWLLLAAAVKLTVVAGENLTVGSTVWLPAESVAPGR